MKKKNANGNCKLAYAKIPHAQRIEVIFRCLILQQGVATVSEGLDLKYNSVRNILLTYLRTGRTNKMTYKRTKSLSQQIGKATDAQRVTSLQQAMKANSAQECERGVLPKLRRGQKNRLKKEEKQSKILAQNHLLNAAGLMETKEKCGLFLALDGDSEHLDQKELRKSGPFKILCGGQAGKLMGEHQKKFEDELALEIVQSDIQNYLGDEEAEPVFLSPLQSFNELL